MGFHNHNSAIQFRQISPFPSPTIPGGSVVEKVVVPWLTDPIGVIVSCPSEKPPDSNSWGRIRTLWYYVPTSTDGKILRCDTILEEIHVLARDYYRRIYDNRNAPRGTSIASGDDCEIEQQVIEWAGLTQEWYDTGLCERHSFCKEILDRCTHVEIRTREWEGGGPGLSGVWFSVRTKNANELRKEIAAGFENLVAEDRRQQEKAKELLAVKKANRKTRKRKDDTKAP